MFRMGQLKYTNNLFVSMILCLLASTNKIDITSQRSLKFIGFLTSFTKKTKQLRKNREKHSFEIIIIVISLSTNFIASFHGLHLLAAHSYSFQRFLFPFCVQHVEKSLKQCQTRGVNPLLKEDITKNIT